MRLVLYGQLLRELLKLRKWRSKIGIADAWDMTDMSTPSN